MRVMLATPTLFREPQLEYAMSVMKTCNLLMQNNIAMDTCFVGGDAFISKARNGLVQSFIETWKTDFPAEVLVFVDDDQSWEEHAFLRIIQDLTRPDSTHEVIGVAIPKKVDSDPVTFNNVLLDTDEKGNCYVENGLLRSSQIGSGFLAIKRSAIEKLIAANPQRYAPGDGGVHPLHYNLFEAKIFWDEKDPTITGQFWGEDLVFCKKLQALNIPVWIDPNVTVEHIGRKSWQGNFMQHLQKHASVEVTTPAPQITPIVVPIPETLEAIERIAA